MRHITTYMKLLRRTKHNVLATSFPLFLIVLVRGVMTAADARATVLMDKLQSLTAAAAAAAVT